MMDILNALPEDRAMRPAAQRDQRQLLVEAVSAHSPHSHRWAPRTVAIGLSAGVLLTSGAAAAYVAFAPATDHSRVRCYTEARVGSDSSYHGTDATQADGGPGSGPVDPVELCGAIWRAGILRVGSVNAGSPTDVEQPIPSLIACRLNDGVAAVFPGDDSTCVRLGLPALSR